MNAALKEKRADKRQHRHRSGLQGGQCRGADAVQTLLPKKQRARDEQRTKERQYLTPAKARQAAHASEKVRAHDNEHIDRQQLFRQLLPVDDRREQRHDDRRQRAQERNRCSAREHEGYVVDQI